MKKLICVALLGGLVSCTTLVTEDGVQHKVMDVGLVEDTTTQVATVANMFFPGIGIIIQSIGGAIAAIGAGDIRRKKGM